MITASVIAAGLVIGKELGWIDPDSDDDERKKEEDKKARGTEMHIVKSQPASEPVLNKEGQLARYPSRSNS